MAIYKQPIKGKCGIRSGVSGKMVFGICCDTAKECKSELTAHVGYYGSLKWRWHTSQWNENDLADHQKYLEEKREMREAKKEEWRYRKECAKWVNENKHKLKDEYIKKIDESEQGIKIKMSWLKQWLNMPERLKEEIK